MIETAPRRRRSLPDTFPEWLDLGQRATVHVQIDPPTKHAAAVEQHYSGCITKLDKRIDLVVVVMQCDCGKECGRVITAILSDGKWRLFVPYFYRTLSWTPCEVEAEQYLPTTEQAPAHKPNEKPERTPPSVVISRRHKAPRRLRRARLL